MITLETDLRWFDYDRLDTKVTNYPYFPYRTELSKDVIVYMFYTNISFGGVPNQLFIVIDLKTNEYTIKQHWIQGWQKLSVNELPFDINELLKLENLEIPTNEMRDRESKLDIDNICWDNLMKND